MDELSKALKFNSLLVIYQNLLTDTQKDILIDYYNFDLSITEISENRSVSRAAVEDAIKKGSKKLENFESQLHILERNKKILKLVEKMKQNPSTKQDDLDEIERIITNGI